MKKLFLLTVLFVAAIFSACSHDDCEPIVLPDKQPLAITFAEVNSLEFDVDETKTVHYTITGGGAYTVVKAEMQNLDSAYTLSTTPTSATGGTITITAKKPSTENRVIVSVSDGSQTIMTAIAVSTKPSPQKLAITVETPGTLLQLLANYDKTKITELTVIGNLNSSDIMTLKSSLPNLAILDMEQVALEVLPSSAFEYKKSLISVKLPNMLTTIGDQAFNGCSGLTSVTIGNNVKSIGDGAFISCTGLTSIYCKAYTPPSVGYDVFYNVSATLYVPTGRKAVYATANGWNNFTTIIETQF